MKTERKYDKTNSDKIDSDKTYQILIQTKTDTNSDKTDSDNLYDKTDSDRNNKGGHHAPQSLQKIENKNMLLRTHNIETKN